MKISLSPQERVVAEAIPVFAFFTAPIWFFLLLMVVL